MKVLCSARDCTRPTRGRKPYCHAHSERLRRGSNDLSPVRPPAGAIETKWVDPNTGYVYWSPGDGTPRDLEHRIVMARHLGRPLLEAEAGTP